MLSALKGYRTLFVNGLALLVAVLVMTGAITLDQAATVDPNVIANNLEAAADAADHIQDTEKVAAGVIAGLAVVNAVLRLFTTTPLGKKK